MKKKFPWKNLSVILVAAGESLRLPGSVRKPFLKLAGKPVIVHTLENFLPLGPREIILVLHPRDLAHLEKNLNQTFGNLGVAKMVAGGKSRTQSVRAGLGALCPEASLVAIHDAVRPFLEESSLKKLMQRAWETGAAIFALPLKDTVKETDADFSITSTLDRTNLWLAQTPQVFHTSLILKAYEKLSPDAAFTDDAQVAEAAGFPVQVVPGSPRNMKITFPEDLNLARALLAKEEREH
ncbi:MAG: hypothetical protein AMS15_03220 [Planctomycetes bacterium DG_23]|nr:MAG: hypothetical protein AMS15_03220 [Planctomycetes bacterium DG_23]